MKNHTSQELTKLLGKINEKLDDMQKSQNGIVTHLKNRCIQERRLDKDLFQYPIDVHIFNHEFMNVNKNMSLFVSAVFPDEFISTSTTGYFYLYKNEIFN